MSDERASRPDPDARDDRAPRVVELQRRIREIESSDDARFGSFGAVDWISCVLLSIVLPLLAFWRFA